MYDVRWTPPPLPKFVKSFALQPNIGIVSLYDEHLQAWYLWPPNICSKFLHSDLKYSYGIHVDMVCSFLPVPLNFQAWYPSWKKNCCVYAIHVTMECLGSCPSVRIMNVPSKAYLISLTDKNMFQMHLSVALQPNIAITVCCIMKRLIPITFVL